MTMRTTWTTSTLTSSGRTWAASTRTSTSRDSTGSKEVDELSAMIGGEEKKMCQTIFVISVFD